MIQKHEWICNRNQKSDHQKSRGKYVEIFFGVFKICEFVQKCNSRLRAWGGVGGVALPTAASGPSALQALSASNVCASPSCQESSCPPPSPHLTPTPFSFCFGLWNSCPVHSCLHLQLWTGGKFCQRKQKNKKARRAVSAPMCSAPWQPILGSSHSVAGRPGKNLLLETDAKWSEMTRRSFSSSRNPQMRNSVERSWTVLYSVCTCPTPHSGASDPHSVWSDLYCCLHWVVAIKIYVLFGLWHFRGGNMTFFLSLILYDTQKLGGQTLLCFTFWVVYDRQACVQDFSIDISSWREWGRRLLWMNSTASKSWPVAAVLPTCSSSEV